MFKRLRNLFSPTPSPDSIARHEALYAQYFGAAPNIYHSTDHIFPHVDVYHSEPTTDRPFHTLITGGMAAYRQPAEQVPPRVELLMYARNFQGWNVNLLKVIAEYPAQNQTSLAAFHTIPIGFRLTESAEISAFLLAPAELEDRARLAHSVDGESVTYLVCIPITAIEHAFAREVSSEHLLQKLKEAGLLIHSDDERRSIIDYTPIETK